jgi:hypothetical protein
MGYHAGIFDCQSQGEKQNSQQQRSKSQDKTIEYSCRRVNSQFSAFQLSEVGESRFGSYGQVSKRVRGRLSDVRITNGSYRVYLYKPPQEPVFRVLHSPKQLYKQPHNYHNHRHYALLYFLCCCFRGFLQCFILFCGCN